MSVSVKYLTPLPTSYINKKYKLYDIIQDVNKENFLPIKLTNVDISVANGLKRIFTSEIPTMAFDTNNVKILTNTSQYHREVLIERLGFITINLDNQKKYNFDDLVFALCDSADPTKPLKNSTDSILKISVHKHLYIQQTSTKSKIPADEICPYDSLLLTLNPGEAVHTVMKASTGLGKQHPIWQSSITMYKFETEQDSTDKLESNEEQMAYLGSDRKQPTGIILTIESVGKLPSYMIVHRGIEVLKQKLEFFKQHVLLGDKSDIVSVEVDENIPNLVKLKIVNEDHTLGHILESACLSKLKELIKISVQAVVKGVASPETEMDLLLESLSAYRKPHPLDNYIELSARTPQKYELIFPSGQYDEVDNPTIRMILLAVEDVQHLCDLLMEDAKVLL